MTSHKLGPKDNQQYLLATFSGLFYFLAPTGAVGMQSSLSDCASPGLYRLVSLLILEHAYQSVSIRDSGRVSVSIRVFFFLIILKPCPAGRGLFIPYNDAVPFQYHLWTLNLLIKIQSIAKG